MESIFTKITDPALVSLAYQHQRSGRVETVDVQRRSVADWARLFAKPGRWQSVRGYRIWCRLDGDNRLRIALRVELFSQIPGAFDLASLGHEKFGDLAELYEVGTRKTAEGRAVKVKWGNARAVELTTDFIEDLYAEPVVEATGVDDGQTDAETHARAREADSASV